MLSNEMVPQLQLTLLSVNSKMLFLNSERKSD